MAKIQKNLQTLCYLNDQGKLSRSCRHRISDKELVKGYKIMMLTRHIDERMVTLQRQGTITFALSSLGEEACAVAGAHALKKEDWIYPQYRESGVMFWRGYSPSEYLHQMFGDAKDLIKGRQMPNHFGSKELNVVPVSSPIATKIPHAAGSAYAMKLQGEKSVAMVYFGDGATSEGDFHVGVNFAAVKRAPVIFFCRNNGYAISVPVTSQFVSDGIAPKGVGYGVETIRVDGNDYFAVHEAVQKARTVCLEGKGPFLIEAMTYRMGAHSTSDDPTRYRTNKEVDQWKQKCPILRLGLYLQSKKLWNKKKELEWSLEIKKMTDKAIEEAKKTARPKLRTLVEDVYFQVPESLEKQFQELQTFFPKE